MYQFIILIILFLIIFNTIILVKRIKNKVRIGDSILFYITMQGINLGMMWLITFAFAGASSVSILDYLFILPFVALNIGFIFMKDTKKY